MTSNITTKLGFQLHIPSLRQQFRRYGNFPARPDLRLKLSDVQILCNDCNMGKGSHCARDRL